LILASVINPCCPLLNLCLCFSFQSAFENA
jgi:hypothetical protein